MKRNSFKKAFTVPELLVVCAFAALLLILFFVQKSNVDAMNRDEKRKTAINAMYYALEESFYATNKYYPETINESVLTVIDPELFTDPNGAYINTDFSSYSYEATNCKDAKCKSYTLRAELEKEDSFIKRNRN
ncbi:type II secretion system protein [Candidatus Saccharibacteria bacterium]|nr:type II secretion system protein [Candidatus Saccharibacteria bacterium]